MICKLKYNLLVVTTWQSLYWMMIKCIYEWIRAFVKAIEYQFACYITYINVIALERYKSIKQQTNQKRQIRKKNIKKFYDFKVRWMVSVVKISNIGKVSSIFPVLLYISSRNWEGNNTYTNKIFHSVWSQSNRRLRSMQDEKSFFGEKETF